MGSLYLTFYDRVTAYTDVTISPTVRKSIFGFRLWRPRKQWAQRHEGVSSRDLLPRTDTADHGQSREHTAASTVGSRNTVSNSKTRLSEYTLAVVELCGDGQR